MNKPACYDCKTRPAAGNSAYCATCAQTHRRPPLPPDGGVCQCAGCGEMFLNLAAFDTHQRVDAGRVVCGEPAGFGFTQNGRGVWGTPEGHASREAAAVRMAQIRADQLEMAAERGSPGVVT